jgi:hypothetical protein
MFARQIPKISLSIRYDIYHNTLFNFQFLFLFSRFGFRRGGGSKVAKEFSGWMDGWMDGRKDSSDLFGGRVGFLKEGLKGDEVETMMSLVSFGGHRLAIELSPFIRLVFEFLWLCFLHLSLPGD